MKRSFFKNERGIALLTAVILLFILGAIASTFMILTTTDVRISSNQAIASRLLFISEAGISEMISRLASGDTTLTDSCTYQDPNWRAEIHLTNDDDSLRIVFRSPTRQPGDPLPYVSEDHHVEAKYLRGPSGDSIIYFNARDQSRESYHEDEPPPDPFLFPIVRIDSEAKMKGMRRKLVVETTMKRTNPFVEGALNFGGHAEFTGSPMTFYGNSAVNNFDTLTPLIKKENTFPFDIYVDKNEDGEFNRGEEWGFYAIWNSGSDSLQRYDLNLDRLIKDARLSSFGVSGTYWAEWPRVSHQYNEFRENGDLIGNGNISFKRTPRIHGSLYAHGDVLSFDEDSLSYVTGEILTDQPPKPLLFVDFDTTYWKDLDFKLVPPESLGSGTYENWSWIPSSRTARYVGSSPATFTGKFFFMDTIQTVLIDSTLLGYAIITTPGNVVIRNNVIFSGGDLGSDYSLFIAQYNIILSGDKLFIRAGLFSQLGNLVVEGKNPVIHGFVMVGGNGNIDKDLAIVLMDFFNSKDFAESALFQKRNTYNMTTLSWREVSPY